MNSSLNQNSSSLEPQANPASRLEKYILIATLGLAFFWVAQDSLWWHPGFSAGDETQVVQRVEEVLEGLGKPWRPTGGFLSMHLLALSCRLWGRSLAALQIPGLLILIFESLLLFVWVRRKHGERAAAWSVILNSLSTFSLLRWRHLLCFTTLPLELLILLFLLPYAVGLWGLVWGFGATLFLFDYEAWVLAFPLVIFLWFLEHQRRSGWPLLAGIALGFCLIACISPHFLKDYFLVRGAQSGAVEGNWGLLQGISRIFQFFFGSPSAFISSFPNHPSFPLFFLPALALGGALAWRSDLPTLACAIFGLLPLLPRASGFEPHRALVAWPFLCCLAGLGTANLLCKIGRPLMKHIFVLALASASLFELKAYQRGMNTFYPLAYGNSLAYLKAADYLKQSGWRGKLLENLDCNPRNLLTFLIGGQPSPSQNGQWLALVPPSYAGNFDPTWGSWSLFASSGQLPPIILLHPSGKTLARLQQVNQILRSLVVTLPEVHALQHRDLVLAFLQQHPSLDPWVQTACWEAVVQDSFYAGDVPPALILQALHQPLISSRAYVMVAHYAVPKNPSLSLPLLEKALQMNSHDQHAWDLYFQVLTLLDKPRELSQARQTYQKLAPAWLWSSQEL